MYSKLEIQGELMFIKVATSKNGKAYANGIISTWEENPEGKKLKYGSIGFIAFDDNATKIEVANLKKGDTLTLNGYIQNNNYQDKQTIQLIVEKVDLSNQAQTTYQEPAPTKKANAKPAETINDTNLLDDLPF